MGALYLLPALSSAFYLTSTSFPSALQAEQVQLAGSFTPRSLQTENPAALCGEVHSLYVFIRLWEHGALFTFPTVLPVPPVSSLDCRAEAAVPLSSLPFRFSLSPALKKKTNPKRSLLCPSFLSTSMSRASAALVCAELQVPPGWHLRREDKALP